MINLFLNRQDAKVAKKNTDISGENLAFWHPRLRKRAIHGALAASWRFK
jgi:hypothetical protein